MTTIVEFHRQLHAIPLTIRGYFNLVEHLYCQHHGRQYRDTGEPYYEHILDVMRQVIDIEKECSHDIDWATVFAAGCHDLIEDTIGDDNPVTKELIEAAFGQEDTALGKEVAFLVDSVSKRPRDLFPDKAARLAEYHERLILRSRENYKVILVKYPDRNHNLATLHGLVYSDPTKVDRIARETLDFYVPFGRNAALEILPLRYHDSFNQMVDRMEFLAKAYLVHFSKALLV